MLFTFPSRYWSTIGLQVVFSLGRWSCLVRTGFLVPRVTLDPPWLGPLTDTGLSPVSPRLSMRCSPYALRARPSSIASTRGFTCCFLFLRLLRCFSSPGSPRLSGNAVACIGLPHSEIPGSKVICTSPELIAACHVFHRLLKPRHPPSALVHFLCNVFILLVGTSHHLVPFAHAHGLVLSHLWCLNVSMLLLCCLLTLFSLVKDLSPQSLAAAWRISESN